jgi:zinc transport system substrate-binding protein
MRLALSLVIITTLIALVVLAGKTSPPLRNSLQVYTSIYPLYYFTSTITATTPIQVVNLIPAGIEPHDFDPSPRQITQVQSSRLLITIGTLEPWATKLSVQSLALAPQASDPHTWLDPLLAVEHVGRITTTLSTLYPNHAAIFKSNSHGLIDQLTGLHNSYQTQLKTCLTRSFVTSHSAFAHLANRYQLTQIPIAGISPDSEPALKDLAEISSQVKQLGLKYVFLKTQSNPELSQVVAKETGIQLLTLDPIENDQPGNYISRMQTNLQHLTLALTCH